eukprot:UN02912
MYDFVVSKDCDKIGVNSTYFNPFSTFKYDKLKHVNQKEWIDEINQEAITWEAGESEFMADTSVLQFQATLGTTIAPGTLPRQSHNMLYNNMNNIPDSFDAREQWPDCDIGVVYD